MPENSSRPWVRGSCLIIYVLVLFISAFEMVGTFSDVHWALADRVIAAAAPFEFVNPYGLFAVMTTTRQENCH
jgi:hypothetical protein